MADARRLARLARVREVERRRAAEQAAASGGHHDRLRALAERSHDLATSYAARGDACDGATLAGLFGFRREMSMLSARAADDAQLAGLHADQARLALSAAQRRRDLVGDRLEREKQENEKRRDALAPILARSLNKRGETRS